MIKKVTALCAVGLMLVVASSARAGLKSRAIEEGADYVMRKFGKEASKELAEASAELVANKMETLAVKCGEEETVSAVTKVGPRMFRLVADAGEDAAPKTVKLMARVGEDSVWVVSRKKSMAIFLRYGDDAADAMIEHKEIAESIIEQFGAESARALKAVGGQNARRLAMMAEDGQLAAIPERDELLETVGRYGDRAMEWVWRNKGALATTAIVSKFVQNPQPFLDGAVKVIDVGGEKVIQPVAAGIGRYTNWTAVIITSIAAATCLWIIRRWRRAPRPQVD